MRVDAMHPYEGPTTGGNVVRIVGDGFDTRTQVFFGSKPAPKLLVHDAACYVQVPNQECGPVSVSVCDRHASIKVPRPYIYQRASLARESSLTQLVRTLLRNIKAHFLSNTRITVDVDAADRALGVEGDEGITLLARLPGLVLGGPDIRENRLQSRHVGCEVEDARGNVLFYSVPFTADLTFTLTGASRSTVEMFNMLDAALAYIHQAKYVSMPRDPYFPELGVVSWPLSIDGDARVHLDGVDGVRSFGLSFSVRGFDIGTSYPTAVAQQSAGTSIAIAKDPP